MTIKLRASAGLSGFCTFYNTLIYYYENNLELISLPVLLIVIPTYTLHKLQYQSKQSVLLVIRKKKKF